MTSLVKVDEDHRLPAFLGFTPWSLITVVLSVPVWILVVRSAVLSRMVDGGIYLSVSAAISDGLDLYSQVWDNKDPLFYAAMVLASRVSEPAVFFMDVLWFLIASAGAVLLSSRLMSADRALFVGVAATPVVLLGPAYIPGWTNTPGTAMALLSLGLLAARLPIAAGIAAGLLAFIKLPIWPVVAVAFAVPLAVRYWRPQAIRGLAGMGVTMALGVGVLAALGWLGGAVSAVFRNRTYARDVADYFGFEPSLLGRITRAVGDWPAAVWWSIGLAALIVLVFAVLWLGVPRLRNADRVVLVVWGVVVLFGSATALGLTYVWPHHVQMLALPVAVALVLFAAATPSTWPFPAWIVWTAVGSLALSGFGSLGAIQSTWQERWRSFESRVAEIDEVPLDARLLETVPQREFRYARLGSNDDRGYLASARDDAELSCPLFHLYDFSLPADFASTLECIQTVDVVLLTDAFAVFGGSSRAPYAGPILDYVGSNFTCLRIEDRQVCTRNAENGN